MYFKHPNNFGCFFHIFFRGEIYMNENKEPIITVLIFQVVVCILIFAAIFVCKFFFDSAYSEIKEFYEDNMTGTTKISEVIRSDSE